MYVMSATHSRFGPLAPKSRATRSGAGRASSLRNVVRVHLRREIPCRPPRRLSEQLSCDRPWFPRRADLPGLGAHRKPHERSCEPSEFGPEVWRRPDLDPKPGEFAMRKTRRGRYHNIPGVDFARGKGGLLGPEDAPAGIDGVEVDLGGLGARLGVAEVGDVEKIHVPEFERLGVALLDEEEVHELSLENNKA